MRLLRRETPRHVPAVTVAIATAALLLASPALLEAQTPTFAEQVLDLVNQERWANGQLSPLKGVPELTSAGLTHSTNMGQRHFFSHCDVDTGTTVGVRASAAGYFGTFLGENIAAGQTTPSNVVNGWMASPGHRANILNTGYRETGIGYFLDSGDTNNVRHDLDSNCVVESTGNGPYFHYWTQVFGRRTTSYPVVIEREAPSTVTRNVALYLYGAGTMSQMRLRNEAGPWTAWQPFATNVVWQLSAGGGTKTVHVETRTPALQVFSASDSIVYQAGSAQIFADGFEGGNTCAWAGPC